MVNRRQWLSIAACGLIPAAYPVACEPFWLELSHTVVHTGANLPRPVRILHLSDFHASHEVPMWTIDHAIDIGLRQKPDLICVTGDFITVRRGFEVERYVESLRRLPQSAPTFAVLGNHDGGIWAERIKGFPNHHVVERIIAESGITLLHNKSKTMRVNGSDVQLVGVADLWSQEIDAPVAFEGVRADLPTVLLSHNPDSKELLSPFRWHLMLSGHTHGGQVLIPFVGPSFAPVQDKRYVAGLGRWRDRQIYVTRGVGNLHGVRFRCRPEVSMLSLS